jgi:hypothetical protein
VSWSVSVPEGRVEEFTSRAVAAHTNTSGDAEDAQFNAIIDTIDPLLIESGVFDDGAIVKGSLGGHVHTDEPGSAQTAISISLYAVAQPAASASPA